MVKCLACFVCMCVGVMLFSVVLDGLVLTMFCAISPHNLPRGCELERTFLGNRGEGSVNITGEAPSPVPPQSNTWFC